MRLPFLLLFFFFLLSVESNSVLRISDDSTGPWETQTDVESASVAKNKFTVTSPMELSGIAMFAPSPLHGPMFPVTDTQEAAGEYELTYQVVLPHSEDSIYACTALTRSVNDEGDSLAGKIVLVSRGNGCSFNDKALSIASVSGVAVAIHNNVAGMLRPGGSDGTVIPVPLMFFSQADGARMRTYLDGRRAYLKALALNPNTTMPAGHNYSQLLIGSLVGTGRILPTELTALRQIATSFRIGADMTSESALRLWSTLLTDPTLDPCTNRILGIWCERGSVVSLYLKSISITGTFDSAWGSLTKLQYMTLDENDKVGGLTGPVPNEICQLTDMLSMQIEGNSLTSIPDCMGTALTKLRVLLIDRNKLPSLPPVMTAWTNLVWLTASTNSFTTLPSAVLSLPNLGYFDVKSNNFSSLDVSTFDFRSWWQAYNINFGTSGLRGVLPAYAFDGLTRLELVDFNTNALSSPVPSFINCTDLNYLDLSYNNFAQSLPTLTQSINLVTLLLENNSFTGALPSEWSSFSHLKTLIADSNQLTGPITVIASMGALESASFRINQIVLPADFGGDIGYMIWSCMGTSLRELLLDYNQLAGVWGTGWDSPKKISMSYNALTNIPEDLWTLAALDINFSYNKLVGSVPSDVSELPGQQAVTNFDVTGNPGLTGGWPLPDWLAFATPEKYTTDESGTFECRSFVSPKVRDMKIFFDPTFTEYNACRCSKGRFGNPPLCDIVPVTATLTPYAQVRSNETSIQANDPTLFATLLDSYDSAANGVMASSSNSTRATVLPGSFTDSWYGEDRLTVGLSTYWSIDLSDLRLYVPTQREQSGFATVVANTVAPTSYYQPVRVITIRLHISSKYFVGIQNSLVVSEGTRSMQGTVVTSLLGATWLKSSVDNSTFTRRAEYQARYGAQLASLVDPRLIEVEVRTNTASVYFSSRDAASAHFVATYSYEFTCPSGTVLRIDTTTNRYECLYPIPALQDYDLPVRYAVYIMVALALVFIIVNAVVLGLKWNAPIYRAASRLFVGMILFFLTCLGTGAIQYALEPDLDASPGVCLGRVWMSALPLAGILAVLLVKTMRLYKIFCSTKIMKVTNASDSDLMRTIGIICLLEIILLIVFSALNLSKPELVTLDTIEAGGFTFDKYGVLQCSQEDGFIPWVVVQLVVIFLGMATATFLSFKTRHIPTAFNESSHIMSCCAILMFFFVMIVPLDFWLQDRPEVGVLLQGFGQAFLTFALTGMLMGPKMYIALTYSEADQTAMTREITTGPSANSRGSVMTSNSSSIGNTRASLVSKPAAMPLPAARGSVKPGVGGAGGDTPVSAVPKFGTKAAPLTEKPKPAHVRPSFVRATSGTSTTTQPTKAAPAAAPSPKAAPAPSPALAPTTPIASKDETPVASPSASPSTNGRTLDEIELTPVSPTPAPATPASAAPSPAPASPTASPHVAIHFRVASNGASAPRIVSNGATPGSPSFTPISPVAGDSALDFVKRLRSRLPRQHSVGQRRVLSPSAIVAAHRAMQTTADAPANATPADANAAATLNAPSEGPTETNSK